jgi:nucleotide-binding universal stress UspA family protein
MFKRIVLAVDGSPNSMQAVDHACGLAECFGAKLIMVHAYPHTSDLRDAEHYDSLLGRRKSAGQEILNDARRRIGDRSVDLEEDLLEGPAADAILNVAQTRKADLIILGTRGKGTLEGLLFGSVSTKVAHYAACTVMVVR